MILPKKSLKNGVKKIWSIFKKMGNKKMRLLLKEQQIFLRKEDNLKKDIDLLQILIKQNQKLTNLHKS